MSSAPPSNAIVVSGHDAGLALDDELLRIEQVRRTRARTAGLIADATPRNTLVAYLRDFANFKMWCLGETPPFPSLPTNETAILAYMNHLSEARAASGAFLVRAGTIERRLSSIIWCQEFDNYPNPRTPLIKQTMRSIKVSRSKAGERPPKMAAPLTIPDLQKICRVLDDEGAPCAVRDKALMVVGWACALRRSEICALDMDDVSKVTEEGFTITLGRSKTDQTGVGFTFPVAPDENESMCPVRAMVAWLSVRGESPGPLFCRHWSGKRGGKFHLGKRMSVQQVARLVESLVERAKLKSGHKNMDFSAHSLRAGFITEAVRLGRRESEVQERSRHKTHRVFLGYVRIAQTFDQNPMRGLFSEGAKP